MAGSGRPDVKSVMSGGYLLNDSVIKGGSFLKVTSRPYPCDFKVFNVTLRRDPPRGFPP